MGISAALRSGGYIKISGNLRDEILHWRFLDRWQGKLQWKEENHIVVAMSSESSLFKWGGHVSHPRIGDTEVSDFWPDSMKNLPNMVLEAFALRSVLQSLSQHLKACRVDVQVDNMPLIAAWNNEGSRSSQLNSALKDIFQLTLDTDLVLNLIYVPSACNVADEPSRSIRKSDAMLSERSWGKYKDFSAADWVIRSI